MVSGKTSCQIIRQNMSLESREVNECCRHTEVETQLIILQYVAKRGPGLCSQYINLLWVGKFRAGTPA
jgi:hypothetical protein